MTRTKSGPGGGVVYSTDRGRICPGCGHPSASCCCSRTAVPPVPGDGIVRIGRETKGRKGAGVTIVRGIPLAPVELNALAGELKRKCGSGGTVREGVIEIQGDHRQALLAALEKLGYLVKLAGG